MRPASFAAILLSAVLASTSTPGTFAGDPGENSLRPLSQDKWNASAAAHLLRRAGFGGSPEQVDRLVQMGLNAAVDELVDFAKTPYEVQPPALDPILVDEEGPAERALMTEEERQAYRQKRQMAERQGVEEIRLWWLERMASSPRPLEEKMTLFWHGHFTSGFREVRRALFMKEQNEFLRAHCLGDFRDLVTGISRDRAMLVYLDNIRNEKTAPNENYARELMELFTLGVGNYEEKDIKAAARAFTGWAFNREGFTLQKRRHDFGEKTFLGKTGNFDGDEIIDIILEQPACPRYLATRLLKFFVRPDPDKELVTALSQEIRKNKYELKPVMKTLLKSQAFYHPEARGALVKSPVELLIGSARQLGQPVVNLPQAERALTGMGQELLQPPNVKGWDGGMKWINTATLFNRYNFVGGVINGGGDKKRDRKKEELTDEDPADDDEPKMDMTKPKSRRAAGVQPVYDPLALIDPRGLKTPDEIVDFYAAHLLARPLADDKRAELVGYLRGEKDDFRPTAKNAGQRLRMTIHLICSTPEYQLN